VPFGIPLPAPKRTWSGKTLKTGFDPKPTWCRATSFDHLVGATQQREWDGKTERLGSLEIDDHLDF
jgi:hypothetical protein